MAAAEDGGREAAQATPQRGEGPNDEADAGGEGLPLQAAVAADGDGGDGGGGAVVGGAGDGGAVCQGGGGAGHDVGGHWKNEKKKRLDIPERKRHVKRERERALLLVTLVLS